MEVTGNLGGGAQGDLRYRCRRGYNGGRLLTGASTSWKPGQRAAAEPEKTVPACESRLLHDERDAAPAQRRLAGAVWTSVSASSTRHGSASTMYEAENALYTDPHGKPKPLRDDAREILRQPSCRDTTKLTSAVCTRNCSGSRITGPQAAGDRCTCWRHAWAVEYAQALEQEELKLLGAWRNRATGRYEPPRPFTGW